MIPYSDEMLMMTPRFCAASAPPMIFAHRKGPLRPTAMSASHWSAGNRSSREKDSPGASTFGLFAALFDEDVHASEPREDDLQQRLDRRRAGDVADEAQAASAGRRGNLGGPRLGVLAPDVGDHGNAAGRGDGLGVAHAEESGAAGDDRDAPLE